MIRLPERFRTTRHAAIAGALLFLAGGGVGAAAMHAVRPDIVMAPARPVPIARLTTLAQPFPGRPAIVTLRGRVAENYGGSFILQDGSGRALVQAGRGGDALPVGETVMVQGRPAGSTLHADYVVRADGRIDTVGPGPHRRMHRGGERPFRR